MPFRPFHEEFPALAEMETRAITVFPGTGGKLPPDDYGFVEMFCDEPGCDCRRVFFAVMSSSQPREQAVIAWGWEDITFYEKWMRSGTRSEARKLQGPILNPWSRVTNVSPQLLTLAREVLLKDAEYVERVKRHYQMFRSRIEKPKSNAASLLQALLSENSTSLTTRAPVRKKTLPIDG